MKNGLLAKWYLVIALILLILPMHLAAQDSTAVSVSKEAAGVDTQTCCSPPNGFSITSVTVAPTPPISDDIP